MLIIIPTIFLIFISIDIIVETTFRTSISGYFQVL